MEGCLLKMRSCRVTFKINRFIGLEAETNEIGKRLRGGDHVPTSVMHARVACLLPCGRIACSS